jgi:Fur family ferric uptake transcriptional regulator
LDAYLKSKNLNQSKQRDLIAEVILAHGGHQTAQEMVRRVQAQHASIGAATVYRTVHVLEEAGLLRKTLTDAAGIVLYEASVQESDDHHDHIVCLDCGAIFEFHEPRIEKAQAEVLARNGFTESRHEHILFAHCSVLSSATSTQKKQR